MGKICMSCGEIVHKDSIKCKYCNSKNVEELNSTATLGDYFILQKISNDPKFIKAMMELHDTDIIEYTAKMSQFKQQVKGDKPHCSYCNSTNIEKISTLSKAGSVALWGIFSKKVHKEFHCNNCGADF